MTSFKLVGFSRKILPHGVSKPTVTFWELRTNLIQEVYENIYCTVFFIQLLMREAGKVPDREILHTA